MNRMIESAMVIARRDFTATVFSRAFLLFLLGPLLALGFGGLFGYLGGRADDAALRPTVAVIGTPSATDEIRQAYARLEKRGSVLPSLKVDAVRADADAEARALLAANKGIAVVLTGWPDAPRLTGPRREIERLDDEIGTILDEVAAARAFETARIARSEPSFARTVVDPAGGETPAARHLIARGGQTMLFMLTLLLAGMLLSNLVEEKSNKVIEVLAAAVPVDAIFLGKLVAMLGVSLTGIAVWGGLIAAAIFSILPPGFPMPVPAVGWPLFVLLGAVYYVLNYMIIGGVFLGIGAQASSVREVQTLSMPVTMAQLAVFALASASVNELGSGIAVFAAIFPLSSPLLMIAHAAQETRAWPHLIAIAWQVMWVVLIIRFAAKRFRTGVLKSGGPRRSFWSRKPLTH